MKNQYWVTTRNFTYNIRFGEEPASEDFAVFGPYETLGDAKERARRLIAEDRLNLRGELRNINAIREDQSA